MASPAVVLATGFFDGHTGYNIHTDNFFRALAKRLPLVELDLADTARTNRQKLAAWEAACGAHPGAVPTAIHINTPDGALPLLPLSARHILFTVWEGTELLPSWPPALARYDEVWTPSPWGQAILQKALPPGRVRVVPEGVDPDVFRPDGPAEAAIAALGGFTFIHVGKCEARKGTELLLDVFRARFAQRDDAQLVLSIHNPFVDGFRAAEWVRARAPVLAHRIHCLDPVEDHAALAGCFRAADAAVFPTRAEGWGLPIMEAMACGLPTVATHCAAVTSYLDESNGCPVPGPQVPVPPDSGFAGTWAEPDGHVLGDWMERLMADRAWARDLGARAAESVRGRFSWDAAADIALSALTAAARDAAPSVAASRGAHG